MLRRCSEAAGRAFRRAVGAALVAAGVLAGPADAQVQPAFKPGDGALISAATEAGLVQAIAQHQRIVAAGGWTSVQASTLKINDNNQAVAQLRARLQASGDLPPGPLSTFYDREVQAAVLRFQVRHGIRPTGVVSGLTLAHMNVSAPDRLVQLQANLARLRAALPSAGRGRAIVVNAPAFELQAVSDGRVEFVTRVIVGRRATETPVVSTTVQNIDLMPFWHVPDSIAGRDMIPTIRKEPNYLASKRIRVYSSFGGGEVDPASVNWATADANRFSFRQDPGPWNALGLIRMDMPNKHIVYMHDTPMKDLFGQDERAFSAGCVRVQNVDRLAAWALNGQDGWTVEGINAATGAGQKQTIKLARPVPVHFVYLTAWVQDGVVQFRNDLYNRDQAAPSVGGQDRVAAAPFQGVAP